MRNKFLGLAGAFLLTLLSITPALGATSDAAIMPPWPDGDSGINFLGQNHAYSVTFRGNGEAVVLFKTVFSNQTEQSLTELNFRFPKINPQDISVFQVIRDRRCVRYNSGQRCLQYQEPDYFQYWYEGTKYQKTKFSLEGDTLKVVLPAAVKTGGSGSIFVYYRGFGYAHKNLLGVYGFTFETLKVNEKIHQLQIGINTDADYYLKGAKGQIDYRFEEGVSTLKMAPSAESGVASAQMDSLYQQIGYGVISKTASDLQALESYTAKGSFADSRWKLYAQTILGVTAGIAIVLFLLGLLIRGIFRKVRGATTSGGSNLTLGIVLGAGLILLVFIFMLVGFLVAWVLLRSPQTISLMEMAR